MNYLNTNQTIFSNIINEFKQIYLFYFKKVMLRFPLFLELNDNLKKKLCQNRRPYNILHSFRREPTDETETNKNAQTV